MKGKGTVVSWQFSVHGWRPALERRRPSTGFTLVEMLVALALVSTIATMVYGSYAAVSRSLDLYGRRAACSERACLVLRLMARQVRCAYMPPSPAGATRSSPQNSPLPVLLPTVFRADARDASGAILSFITTAGLATGPNAPRGMARVMYRHDPVTGTLAICCEPYAYAADDTREPGPWRPMLSGVARVDLQCYDGRQWQVAWDGENPGLPQAVRITLTVVDERNRPREFATTALIGSRTTSPKQKVSIGTAKL